MVGQAILKVTSDAIERVLAHKSLTKDEEELTQILLQITELVNVGKFKKYSNWTSVKKSLLAQKDTVIHQLSNFSILVENSRISQEQTIDLKHAFIGASGSEATNEVMDPIREFLCEAFCLVDIVDDLLKC